MSRRGRPTFSQESEAELRGGLQFLDQQTISLRFRPCLARRYVEDGERPPLRDHAAYAHHRFGAIYGYGPP